MGLSYGIASFCINFHGKHINWAYTKLMSSISIFDSSTCHFSNILRPSLTKHLSSFISTNPCVCVFDVLPLKLPPSLYNSYLCFATQLFLFAFCKLINCPLHFCNESPFSFDVIVGVMLLLCFVCFFWVRFFWWCYSLDLILLVCMCEGDELLIMVYRGLEEDDVF